MESYYPTIENTFSKVIKYKGQEFSTEIIDTAGQVRMLLFIMISYHFPSITCKDRVDKDNLLTERE